MIGWRKTVSHETPLEGDRILVATADGMQVRAVEYHGLHRPLRNTSDLLPQRPYLQDWDLWSPLGIVVD